MKKIAVALLFTACIAPCMAAGQDAAPISEAGLVKAARATTTQFHNLSCALDSSDTSCPKPPAVQNTKATDNANSARAKPKNIDDLFGDKSDSDFESTLSSLSDAEEKSRIAEEESRTNAQIREQVRKLLGTAVRAYDAALKCAHKQKQDLKVDCKSPQQLAAVFGNLPPDTQKTASDSKKAEENASSTENVQQDIDDRKSKLAQAWISTDATVASGLSAKNQDFRDYAERALEDAESVNTALTHSQTAANLWAILALKTNTAISDDPAFWEKNNLENKANQRAAAVYALSLEIAYNKAFIDAKLQEIAQLSYKVEAYRDVAKYSPDTAVKPASDDVPAKDSDAPFTQKVNSEANLLALLAKFPNTNFTGTNKTATLSAGAAGSNATISIGLEQPNPAHGDDLFSIAISAPTSSSGKSTTLLDHADGFTNMFNVKVNDTFSRKLYLGVPQFGDTLNFMGLSFQAGYQQHQYYTPDNIAAEQTSNMWAGGLGLYDGFAWEDGHSNSRSVTLSASWQENEKDQTSQTMCPLPATGSNSVTCVTGPKGAPSESLGWLFSVGFRSYFVGGTALTPTVSYNTNTKEKEFDVPWYFIHNSDKTSSSTFNGGLDINWTSDKHWNVGVFVGAPLSLIGGN